MKEREARWAGVFSQPADGYQPVDPDTGLAGHPLRVLYLEDNRFDSDLTLRQLATDPSGEFRVSLFETVTSAMGSLEECRAARQGGGPIPYDLALLNLRLPDGDGWGVLVRIREWSLPMAIVVLTASGDEETAISSLRCGADDYITKSLEYREHLPALLKSALRRFRSHAALVSKPIRLFYVEPNPVDADLLRRHLARSVPYIRLETAETPEELLARLPAAGPVTDIDAVLLDFQLPGRDGLEVFKEIQQIRGLDVPVLILTGQGREEVAVRALRMGAADYLVKSFGYLDRLPAAVEAAYYRSLVARDRVQMREKNNLLQSIIETEPECVKVVDPAGNLIEMNAAGLAMLEAASLKEAQARNLIEFILPAYREKFIALHRRVMAGGHGVLEFEITGLKGRRCRLETHAAPLRDSEGSIRALLGVTRDITEKKRVEDRLRQHEKLSVIGQMAGGIAHDFNNQLSAILGYAELLGGRLTDPTHKHYLEIIAQAARRSGDLTRSMLAFSRQGQYESVTLDIHALIQETAELLRRSIDKRIILRVAPGDFPALVLGDPAQLQNALLNLALNARDAMPAGGILEFVTERIRLEMPHPTLSVPAASITADPGVLPPGSYVHLKISDTGDGMTEEVKQHLFEPFFTTKPVGKGTGMGLASVYGTVGLHGGAISVESEVGKGSTFHVHLPLLTEGTRPDPGGGNLSRPGRSLSVLLVDDEPTLRDLIGEMLTAEGHGAVKAASGREALELFTSRWRDLDLVILDMMMPDMSGTETLAGLKAIHRGVKVLMVSGFLPSGEVKSVQELGAAGFLPKPFEKSQLIAWLAREFSQPKSAAGPTENGHVAPT